MKIQIISAIALAATLPLSAGAVVPLKNLASQPLASCERAVRSEFEGGRITDRFHERMDDGSHRIFLNVVTAEDGEKDAQRITCSTTPTGHRVVDLQAEAGRWVDAKRG